MRDEIKRKANARTLALQAKMQGNKDVNSSRSWNNKLFTLESLQQTNIKEVKDLEKEINELIVYDPEEDAILERQFPSSYKDPVPKKRNNPLDSIQETLEPDRQISSRKAAKKPGSRHTSSQPILPKIVSSTQRLPKIASNVNSKTLTQSRKNSLVELAKATYHPEAKGRRALLRALKNPDDY